MENILVSLRQEFLLDGLEYYCVNPVERRSKVNGGCLYFPGDRGIFSESEGCIIGRKILDKEVCNMFDNLENGSIDFISKNEEYWKLVPEDVRNLGVEFLIMCQELHDKDIYWNKYGLGDKGKIYLSEIIKSHGMDINIFNKFL